MRTLVYLIFFLLLPNVAYAAADPMAPIWNMGRMAIGLFFVEFVLGCIGARRAIQIVGVLGGLILLGQFVYYVRKLLTDAGFGNLLPF